MPPFDKEGAASDAERVDRAMHAFARDFGVLAGGYMEACVHCGICAEACHFYSVTGDAKYTPILKIEPFKQAYKREYGPFAPIYKLFGLKHKVTIDELERWQELLYDSCTLCGRCALICPMGIDITALIMAARHGMAAAGLVPCELADKGGATPPAEFKQQLLALGPGIRVDRAKADIVCTLLPDAPTRFPKSVQATAKLMNHLGLDWTFRSADAKASSLGLFSGRVDWQDETARLWIEGAIATGAKTLIMPECGHPYGLLRWEGANIRGAKLPFHVLHMSEFLAAEVSAGRLKLKPIGKTATFHDPCQVARRGGVFEEPRTVLAALGLDLRETFPTRGTNWCCGGGGGVIALERAAPLRQKAFQLKIQQVMDTEAELAVTSCNVCRRTFEESRAHYHWDKPMLSLLELVADQLDEAAS
jgi:Fe-S oxidoreductase